MPRTAKPKSKLGLSPSRARRVGIAELRGNLAKYLKRAKAGTPVVIEDRGHSAYVLLRFEEAAAAKVAAFGCMRTRTEYVVGAIVNAGEAWQAGSMA